MSGYLSATFRSMRHRAYRLYFTGQIVSTVGTWAQKVAQAWLVLELTGSGTLLGVTVGLQQAPTLFLTPWAGIIADRIDRRLMLLCTNWAAAVPAAAMGVLVLLDRAAVPAIMLLAVLIGIVEAFDKPVRHTFAADIVPTEDVTNAVALNATMFNAGKVLGPAAAGVAIGSAGLAVTFLFNVFSFLVMIVALTRIRPDEMRPRDIRPKERGALREGVDYARRTPVIATALVLMTVTGLVAYEWNTAVPLLAREFSPDAAMIGYFFAAMGAGAIAGSLSLAGILVAAPRTFLGAATAFAAALGVVSLAPSTWTALVAMFVLGAVATTFRALATSLVQLESEAVVRGRVVSLLIMAINGTSPISGPLIGWMSQTYGARVAIGTGAAISLLAALASWRYLAQAAPERFAVPERADRTHV
ncbi:MFS transporter [Micromonospora sp. NPDC050200]|uniref:MFS transporter n=1 Tax=Micromonospora sp. NPDC050200 TaxID=3155664 RepID=UPI0033DE2C0E